MPRFLLGRAAASLAAIAIALFAPNLHQLLVASVALYVSLVLFGQSKTVLRLLGATSAMAIPLALVHGIVNPIYPVSSEVFGVPVRADGFHFSILVSTRLALIFGIFGLWHGTPRRFWIALVATTPLPPAWSVAMLQVITLTHVLVLRVGRIRQAQRSRGILRDDMNLCARVGAAVSVVVPLTAVTLIDANERGILLHRMGFGSYKLRPAMPLSAPDPLDVTLSIGVAVATLALLYF